MGTNPSGDILLQDSTRLRLGELALSINDVQTAKNLFRLALKSKSENIKAHANLRMGDLAIRQRSRSALSKAKKYYQRVFLNGGCLSEMARSRLMLLDEENLESIRYALIKNTRSDCEGVAIEAKYGLATILFFQRQYVEAIERVRVKAASEKADSTVNHSFSTLARRIASDGIIYLHRNRDWTSLENLYSHISQHGPSISKPQLLMKAANAFTQSGFHHRAAEILQHALRRAKTKSETDTLTIRLARAYLRSNQDYMAEVVVDYYRRSKRRPTEVWPIQHIEAELLIRQKDGTAADSVLLRANEATPRDDPMSKWMMLRAEAASLLNRGAFAGQILLKLLKRDWHPSLSERGRGVKILSQCARQCSPQDLERLLKALSQRGHSDLINNRIRYLSKQRGVPTIQETNKDTLWGRLERITPTEPQQ